MANQNDYSQSTYTYSLSGSSSGSAYTANFSVLTSDDISAINTKVQANIPDYSKIISVTFSCQIKRDKALAEGDGNFYNTDLEWRVNGKKVGDTQTRVIDDVAKTFTFDLTDYCIKEELVAVQYGKHAGEINNTGGDIEIPESSIVGSLLKQYYKSCDALSAVCSGTAKRDYTVTNRQITFTFVSPVYNVSIEKSSVDEKDISDCRIDPIAGSLTGQLAINGNSIELSSQCTDNNTTYFDHWEIQHFVPGGPNVRVTTETGEDLNLKIIEDNYIYNYIDEPSYPWVISGSISNYSDYEANFLHELSTKVYGYFGHYINLRYGVANGQGEIEGSISRVKYDQEIILTAKPSYGYRFVRWEDNSTNPIRTFVATTDHTIIAYFERIYYTLNSSISEITPNEFGGTISYAGTNQIGMGNSITIYARPLSGYKFDKMLKTTDGINFETIHSNSVTFTMTENVTYIAYFLPVYVSFDSVFNFQRWKDNGITSDPSRGTINNLTDTGFVFQSLTGDGYTNQSPTFKVTRGKQYTFACDILGESYQIYIFHCPTPDPGSWTSQPSGQQFSVLNNQNTLTFTALTNYISIRCDADGNGNAVSFSNFRVYPKDFNYFSTVVTPDHRSDRARWEDINKLPRREWHTFDGWYTDPIDGTLYNASSAFPTDDLTLYSQWTGTIPRTFLVQTNERQILYKNGAFLPGKTVHFKWKEE